MTHQVLTALAVLALTSAAQEARRKPVTLEALSSMPPTGTMMGGAPVWAPDGERFAFRQGGKLMLYEVKAKSSKELLTLSELEKAARPVPRETVMTWENRRVSERPIQWSADGKMLLLAVNADLFLFTLEGGKWQALTDSNIAERDGKLSPDGKKVSFRRENDLYVMDVASKAVTRLTHDGSALLWNGRLDWVYPEELELGTAHWWSPDSSKIAYLQFDVSREPMYPHSDHLAMQAVSEPQRYPKAGTPNAEVRLGVVAAGGGRTKWMDLGETRDYLVARVHWMPDSKRVAAFRMNRVQNLLWILAADAENGRSRLLHSEEDPHWININDDFRFLKSGGFLWTSEKDGYRHIYLHGEDGRADRQITKGPWEVSSVACVNEDTKKVYYASTEKSPLERHFFEIGLDGKGKRQLSAGEGTHGASMGPGCKFYLESYSSLTAPARQVLRAGDGSEVAVYQEANRGDQEEFEILPAEIHTVKGADGTVFYARLIKPAGFDARKKYAAVVFVYGGPHAQSVRNAWAGARSWEQVLAHKGFVIWQLDNRGSAGRGHAWETRLYRRLGKQELEDQKTGVQYLAGLGFVDPAKVGITGWSYGGYMTLYSLLHAPETFAAGVAGAAVTDWRNYDTIYTERYLGLPQENEQGYKDSSPVSAAAKLQGKLLLVHNLEDDNVLIGNAIQMSNALQLARKPFEMQYYAGKSHGLTGPLRGHYMETATRFFEQALKP